MSNTFKPPIIDGAFGTLRLPSLCIFLRDDWEYVESAIHGRAPPNLRTAEVILAFYHETVHFLQVITTRFLYLHSYELRSVFKRLINLCRFGNRPITSFRVLSQEYRRLTHIISAETDGVSPLHLIEAAAITESFLMLPGKKKFHAYLEYYYQPPSLYRYRKVIEIIRHHIADEDVLRVTGPICFASLNAVNPGRAFWQYIKNLENNKKRILTARNTNEILEVLGFNASKYLYDLFTLISSKQEPLLKDVLDYITESNPDTWFVDHVASPSVAMRERPRDERIEALRPFLVVCSGGKARVQGVAVRWPKRKIPELNRLVAACGACERILSEKNPYLACPYTECPIHETRLCNTMYPPRESWKKCAFPGILHEVFGLNHDQLMKLRSDISS